MKKILIALLLSLGFLLSSPACADHTPRPILYTCYRQMGWGDRVEIGYADSNGDLWTLNGYDSELEWPYGPEAQLQFLEEHDFCHIGTLTHDDLFDLESLVYAVEAFDGPSFPVAEDAGTERAYAIKYDRDGNVEPVLLGMSGDDMFENPDPNAQGLYLAAHKLFSNVTCYGESMGPAGFTPVSISEFCGLGDLTGASVKAFYMDCEAGPREIELSVEEQAQFLQEVLHSLVTGKVSAIDTTGGYRDYEFYNGNQLLGRISIYNGRLYCPDGMYSVERSES